MTGAIFKLEHLAHYKIIREPGTYFCTCASDIQFSNLYSKDGHPRWIVPLRVLPECNIEQMLEIIQNGNSTVLYKEVMTLFLSGAIWSDSITKQTDLPVKGEKLICNFDMVGDRLLCTNLSIPPRVELDSFKLTDYLDLKFKLNNLLNIKH